MRERTVNVPMPQGYVESGKRIMADRAKEQAVKLPLRIDDGIAVEDADGEPICLAISCDVATEIVALANSHAAQPGPPREDGEYIVRTSAIDNNVLVKRRNGVNVIALVGIQVPDDKILCHRKSEPLEVPK